VSRFYRDGAVFDALRDRVLPALAAATSGPLRVWSAGCAAGEEPYTLALLWELAAGAAFPDRRLQILATDADADSIARAQRACYQRSSAAQLPAGWREAAFVEDQGQLCLRERFRAAVELRCQDLRRTTPEGLFHLILCRNLAFTYFSEADQGAVALRLAARLLPGGALLIGARERLPARPPLVADEQLRGLYWARPLTPA
jgi:chemotaxis protein methyltransferase CheR